MFMVIICIELIIAAISCLLANAQKIPYGQNIILLMIDGFGNNLLNQTDFGFHQMIDNGVRADYLKPVFPTQDFPNWMSLLTGLYVEDHGFTSDYMWDRKTGSSFLKGDINVSAEMWWHEHPAPAWYTAGKSNIDVHCYWIAGCDVPHVDMVIQVPKDRVYSATATDQTESLPTHFPEIIERIVKYQSYKQQFFLLRYGGLRKALEMFGADSDEVKQALTTVDLMMMDLQQKLDEAKLFESTNLVVLSTFGVHQLDAEHQFVIEECLADYSRIEKVAQSNAMSMIYTDPNELDEVYFELKVCDQWAPMGDYDDDEQPLVIVYRAPEIPERYHWRNSRFMSEIVLITRPGASLSTRELPSVPPSDTIDDGVRQTAGWDNEHNSMHGVFIARGPAFKSNYHADAISVVDIYQVILNIFGIEPQHRHNGTWGSVEGFLNSGWEMRSSTENTWDAASSSSSNCLINYSIILIASVVCLWKKKSLSCSFLL